MQTEPQPEMVTPKLLLAISAFWFGQNFLWSALLPAWLPERIGHFAGTNKGTATGWIDASGAFVSTMIQLLIGPLSDRSRSNLGRRLPFILFGVAGTIPALIYFAGATSIWHLVAGLVLVQLLINIATGPYQALMPDIVPRQFHGLASAYMGVALLLGQGIALAVGGLLVAGAKPGLDLRSTYIEFAMVISGVLVVTCLWTLLGARERFVPAQMPKLRVSDILPLGLLEEPNFAWLIASRFMINMGFYTALAFLMFYMQDSIGLGNHALVPTFTLFLLSTFAGLIGNWPAGVLSDRMSKKRVLYATCCIIGIAAIAFLFAKSLAAVYVIGIVFGIGWGAFCAVDWALAANLVPMQEAGRYMAIWHLAFTLPQVFAPLMVGHLADVVNHAYGHGLGWRVAISFILIYLALGVICIRYIRERPVDLQQS